MITKFRLALSTFLIWAAWLVCPAVIRPIFSAHLFAVKGAMKEIESGRTFGLLYAGWSLGGLMERQAAADMEEAANSVALPTRRLIEKRIAEGRYP